MPSGWPCCDPHLPDEEAKGLEKSSQGPQVSTQRQSRARPSSRPPRSFLASDVAEQRLVLNQGLEGPQETLAVAEALLVVTPRGAPLASGRWWPGMWLNILLRTGRPSARKNDLARDVNDSVVQERAGTSAAQETWPLGIKPFDNLKPEKASVAFKWG